MPTGSPQDERLEQAIAEYLTALERGESPDRAAFLGRYPDLASELGSFFAAHDAMRQAAAPDPTPTTPFTPQAAAGESIRALGEYELLEELGRGGMGIVYRARHKSLNRPVAVKLLLAGSLAGADAVERFEREARNAAGLDHPGIVPVYDFERWQAGDGSSLPFFTMKLIEGPTLATYLAEHPGPVAPRTAALVVAFVASAVQHAHERGVLHRDIKPGNILLQPPADLPSGQPMDLVSASPVLADFGLARHEQDATLTSTGVPMGTLAYMAPEQAAGKHRDVTTAADVYSLGAVLYRLLTGQPALAGDNPLELLRRVATEDPLPPGRLNREVPKGLEAICLMCLRKNPKERYRSAEALADDLVAWLNGKPVKALEAPGVPRPWYRRLRLRRVMVAVALACVPALLLGGLMAGGYLKGKRVYAGDLECAKEHYEQEDVPGVAAFVEKYRNQWWRGSTRDEHWDSLERWVYTHAGTLELPSDDILSSSWAPEGDAIAICNATGSTGCTIAVYDLPERKKRWANEEKPCKGVYFRTEPLKLGPNLRPARTHLDQFATPSKWSVSGRYLASPLDEKGNGSIWDAQTGALHISLAHFRVATGHVLDYWWLKADALLVQTGSASAPLEWPRTVQPGIPQKLVVPREGLREEAGLHVLDVTRREHLGVVPDSERCAAVCLSPTTEYAAFLSVPRQPGPGALAHVRVVELATTRKVCEYAAEVIGVSELAQQYQEYRFRTADVWTWPSPTTFQSSLQGSFDLRTGKPLAALDALRTWHQTPAGDLRYRLEPENHPEHLLVRNPESGKYFWITFAELPPYPTAPPSDEVLLEGLRENRLAPDGAAIRSSKELTKASDRFHDPVFRWGPWCWYAWNTDQSEFYLGYFGVDFRVHPVTERWYRFSATSGQLLPKQPRERPPPLSSRHPFQFPDRNKVGEDDRLSPNGRWLLGSPAQPWALSNKSSYFPSRLVPRASKSLPIWDLGRLYE